MELDADDVEALIIGIWLDMGCGLADGVTPIGEIPGLESFELCEAKLRAEALIRESLLGVDRKAAVGAYEAVRARLLHPAYREVPAEWVGRRLGCG